MTFLWCLLLLLIIAQLAVIPFWPRIVRKVIRRRPASSSLGGPTRKFWNLVLNASIYGVVLFFTLIPFIRVSLIIAVESAVVDKKEAPSVYFSHESERFVDIRGQIHVHCYLSHDSKGTLEEITDAAVKNGVRWIILTDHISRLPPGDYPDQLNGVLLVYGCERNYLEGTSVFRASLKDQKETLYLHGHVESFSGAADSKWIYQKEDKDPVIHWDALEVVNFHANALDNKLGILGSVFFYPTSLYNNITTLIPRNFDYWQKLAEREGRPIPIFGAPDAHQNIKILGVQVDPYELTLGLISTHIWIEKDGELNQDTIFEAIKKGRSYIAFDYLGDPTGFKFYAESLKSRCMTGESMSAPKYLSVWAPGEDSYVKTKFYRDNVFVGEVSGGLAYMLDPQPGFWRVELWKDDRPWIISGQILVK
ncbi:MAG: hypothetical protein Q7S83_00510 [bacterium]|nr:hypothetical protein [bacterium]